MFIFFIIELICYINVCINIIVLIILIGNEINLMNDKVLKVIVIGKYYFKIFIFLFIVKLY